MRAGKYWVDPLSRIVWGCFDTKRKVFVAQEYIISTCVVLPHELVWSLVGLDYQVVEFHTVGGLVQGFVSAWSESASLLYEDKAGRKFLGITRDLLKSVSETLAKDGAVVRYSFVNELPFEEQQWLATELLGQYSEDFIP